MPRTEVTTKIWGQSSAMAAGKKNRRNINADDKDEGSVRRKVAGVEFEMTK